MSHILRFQTLLALVAIATGVIIFVLYRTPEAAVIAWATFVCGAWAITPEPKEERTT